MRVRTIFTLALVFVTAIGYTCPVCDKQQPKILQGITHGTGQESNWDYLIVWSTVIIVAFTLFYTIKWMVRPGEKENNHIKRTVIN